MFSDDYKNGDTEKKDAKGMKILKIAGMIGIGVLVAVLFAFLFGFVIKLLWNSFVPDIFGIQPISYWQAVGLFILIKILTGNFYHKNSGNEDKIHKKIDKKIHGIIGVDYDDEHLREFNEHQTDYYNRFWEEKGRDAFEAYVRDIDTKNK